MVLARNNIKLLRKSLQLKKEILNNTNIKCFHNNSNSSRKLILSSNQKYKVSKLLSSNKQYNTKC